MYLCDGLKPSHKYIVEPFANWYICSGLELTGKHLAEGEYCMHECWSLQCRLENTEFLVNYDYIPEKLACKLAPHRRTECSVIANI